MLLKEKDFELFKNKLDDVLRKVEETNNTDLTFDAWLEESHDTEEEHFYDRICFNYKHPTSSIDSTCQPDGHFYNTDLIKNDTVDMSVIDYTEDLFKDLINQTKEIEEQISNLDGLSDHYLRYEIYMDWDAMGNIELHSLPTLAVKFYLENYESFTEYLGNVHLDTFK
ncbi:hypothetical protein [Vagococcus fluvialis]|uniref:hypothetical protein n=1 Tax=Vagococcus fluvialis TaxID=2738 RepID=UPI003D1081C1